MNKEELTKEVKEQLQTIKQHQADLTKLVEALTHVSNADVSFAAIDESKNVLNDFGNVKEALLKTQKALKARAQARMKEG